MELQMRHLLEANDVLREKLAKCRRDYLREITELRDRCRHVEKPVEEALANVLTEEPVMFYEPFEFTFDDLTKDFIRDAVDEKLRLLMLQGWRRVSDKELEGLRGRVAELEVQVKELRDLQSGIAQVEAAHPNLCAENEIDHDSSAHSVAVLHAVAKRLKELELLVPDLRDEVARGHLDLQAMQQRIEELEAEGSSEIGDIDGDMDTGVPNQEVFDASQPEAEQVNLAVARTTIVPKLEPDRLLELPFGAHRKRDVVTKSTPAGSPSIISSAGLSLVPATSSTKQQEEYQRPADGSAIPTRVTKVPSECGDLQRQHVTLDRKYKDLKRKLGRMLVRMQESIQVKDYDQELLADALAFAGLHWEDKASRPALTVDQRLQETCERLYTDCKRRRLKMHARTSEVHVLQRAELERCISFAHEDLTRSRVDEMRGLHRQVVKSNAAFHEALESFHADASQSRDSGTESQNDDATESTTARSHSSRTRQIVSTAESSSGKIQSRGQSVCLGESVQDTSDITALHKDNSHDAHVGVAPVRHLSRPVATPQHSRHSPAWQRVPETATADPVIDRPTIQQTVLASASSRSQGSRSTLQRTSTLGQSQVASLREALQPRGWLPREPAAPAAAPATLPEPADPLRSKRQAHSVSTLPGFCALHSGLSLRTSSVIRPDSVQRARSVSAKRMMPI
jgi:hypothetical protein